MRQLLRRKLILYILNKHFEWNANKAKQNETRHGIAFQQAITIFDDPLQLRYHDSDHSTQKEERKILIGAMDNGILTTIIFTQRDEIIRIIGARRADRKERGLYYENEKTHYKRSR